MKCIFSRTPAQASARENRPRKLFISAAALHFLTTGRSLMRTSDYQRPALLRQSVRRRGRWELIRFYKTSMPLSILLTDPIPYQFPSSFVRGWGESSQSTQSPPPKRLHRTTQRYLASTVALTVSDSGDIQNKHSNIVALPCKLKPNVSQKFNTRFLKRRHKTATSPLFWKNRLRHILKIASLQTYRSTQNEASTMIGLVLHLYLADWTAAAISVHVRQELRHAQL